MPSLLMSESHTPLRNVSDSAFATAFLADEAFMALSTSDPHLQSSPSLSFVVHAVVFGAMAGMPMGRMPSTQPSSSSYRMQMQSSPTVGPPVSWRSMPSSRNGSPGMLTSTFVLPPEPCDLNSSLLRYTKPS